MTHYNLSCSQTARINFDQMVGIYADDCISQMPEDYLIETPAKEIAEAYYGDGYSTDDEEEAKARHTSVFVSAIKETKAELC